MDSYELENWRKIKAHLEEVGSTDNYFYRRSCMILRGESDPHTLPEINEQSS